MKRCILSILSALSCISSLYAQKPIIYITPGQWWRLFDITDPLLNGDDQRQPTYQLKLKLEDMGFEVRQADTLKNLENPYAIIAFDVPFGQLEDLQQYPREKCILFLWEPPSVTPENYNLDYHQYFCKIFTWADEIVDNKRYCKFYYPVMHPMITDTISFDQKKLCTIIACNKGSSHPQELYSARRDIISFLNAHYPHDFDLYGRGWSTQLSSYRGALTRKVTQLKHYKFNICYENVKDIAGYVTEKIFDSFWAGCVPVYWGASNIEYYIPKECFIDRREFASNEELLHFLQTMPENTYAQYIANIQQFLNSSQAARFSIPHFIDTVRYALFGTSRVPASVNSHLYFCTAADEKYFDCLLNLIGSIHKHNFDQLGEIAVFDLGLTTAQRAALGAIQKVNVYTLEHANPYILTAYNTRPWGKPVIGWYSWKPVAIKQAFDIFPHNSAFLWIDAGTTVLKDLGPLFAHIQEHGYFFHNGSSWCIRQEAPQRAIQLFNLNSAERNWLLADTTIGLEAGLMGITNRIYNTVVLPMYQLAHDIHNFVDDGTAPGGFGNSRHDLTLFSILALLNNYQIFHHYQQPRENFMLEVGGNKIPFHIACNPQDRTPETALYCSRFDAHMADNVPFIHRKESLLKEQYQL